MLEQQVKQLHLLSEELSSNEELKVVVKALNTENQLLKSQDFKLKSEDIETPNKALELALNTLSIENELMKTLITQIHIPVVHRVPRAPIIYVRLAEGFLKWSDDSGRVE